MCPWMVSIGLSFRSIFDEGMIEDEGALRVEGGISWLSLHTDYYQINKVQVVDGDFLPYVVLSSGAYFLASGRFFEFLNIKTKQKNKRDCIQTYLFLIITNLNRQLSCRPA